MLQVTDQAANLLYQHLKQPQKENPKTEVAMRIIAQDGKLTWAVDVPRQEDRIFSYQGKPVLVVNQDISDILKGNILDVRKTDQGVELYLS